MKETKQPPRKKPGPWRRETSIDTLISKLFWRAFLLATAVAFIYAIAIGNDQMIGAVIGAFLIVGTISKFLSGLGRPGRR